MRMIKPEPESLKQLIADATAKLLGGTKSVTLNIESLLKLDKPNPLLMPNLYISEVAGQKMTALVQASDKEIAWHGIVTRPDEMTYRIEDVMVYPQEVTGTTVESDDDLYPLWLDELDDDTFNQLRMQGHSHVNMQVFASGTDTDFYETLTQHIKDYYIFIILNKKQDIYVEIRDIKNNILYETKDINIFWEGVDRSTWALSQINEFISTKRYTNTTLVRNTTKSKAKMERYNGLQDDETRYVDEEEDWRNYINYLNYNNGRKYL